MKALISKLTAMTSLLAVMTLLPCLCRAEMHLINETNHMTDFVVFKGDLLLARIKVPPSAMATVRTDTFFQVQALTKRGGQTYVARPLQLDSAKNIDAAIMESEAALSFEIMDSAPSYIDTLTFNNTTNGPVQFTIQREGVPLQSFVVNANDKKLISVEETYKIYAIVNGVTTSIHTTTNPDAMVKAVVIPQQDFEYYDLVFQ